VEIKVDRFGGNGFLETTMEGYKKKFKTFSETQLAG